jgi:cell division protein FtsW
MQATILDFYNRIAQQNRRPIDWVYVGIVALLNIVGLAMAYSTTFFWSYQEFQNTFTIFGRQLMWMGVGTALFIACAWLDYGLLRRGALPVAMLGGVLLLLLAVLLFGDDTFGARRTLASGSLQPSELAKIVVIVYAAAWLASRRDMLQSFSEGLAPFAIIIGVVSSLVILQPDLSTTFVIIVASMAMFFLAGASLRQMVMLLVIGGVAFGLLVVLLSHSSTRLEMFRASFEDPGSPKVNYHIRQLAYTLGGAGFFGHGIGASAQKYNNLLPTPHTDSVLAVLTDEMGLIGLLATFVLFGLFTWRGFYIARTASSPFGAFLAIGVTMWVIVQTLMNTLSVLALIPFTGVPVPFLSIGGSSLVSLMVACGLVLSVARGSTIDDDNDPLPAAESGLQSALARRIRNHGSKAATSAALGRRNSRARVARPHRAASVASAGSRFERVSGVVARLGRVSRKRRSPVRWRD